ncbi:MAG: hypothetical protein ACOYNN_04255 [Terrimicrobiaceae bacterium]
MKKRNHNRAEGMTTLTISLSGEMKQEIEALAAAENRSLSNFAQTYLAAIVSQKTSAIADAPSEYKTLGKQKDSRGSAGPVLLSSVYSGRGKTKKSTP